MTNSSSNNSTVNNNNGDKTMFNKVLNELKAQRKNIAIVGVAALNEVFLYSLAGALTGYLNEHMYQRGASAADMIIEKMTGVEHRINTSSPTTQKMGFAHFASVYGLNSAALVFGSQAAATMLVVMVVRKLFPGTVGSALRFIITDIYNALGGAVNLATKAAFDKEFLPYVQAGLIPETTYASIQDVEYQCLDADGFLVWGGKSARAGQPVHPKHLELGIHDPQVNPIFHIAKTVDGDNHTKNSNNHSTNNSNEEIPMNNVTLSLDALSNLEQDDSDLTAEERAIANEVSNITIAEAGLLAADEDNLSEYSKDFKAYGNPFADTKLTIKYSVVEGKETIRWSRETYKFNQRLVRVLKNYNFEEQKYTFKAMNVSEVIAEILDTVQHKTYRREAQNFLQGLVGTILVSDWEASDEHVNSYNLAAIQNDVANLVDAQKVLRENEVAAYHINKKGHIILKKDHGEKSAWVEGCLKVATTKWGFALPDKTNTKRAFVQDALGIMGMSADGRISMVEADKGGKFFNRHAMVKHISAEVENPVLDNLLAEISGAKFAASYGSLLNSLFINSPLLSLAVGDGGFVVRNPLTFTVNKRVDGKLNIDLLFANNAEYKAHVVAEVGNDRTAQVEFIIAEMEESLIADYKGSIIAPGAPIEFQNQVLTRNYSNLELVLDKEPKVRKGNAINTEVRTIAVSFKTKATLTDYNHKSRGQWFKGMATRNDDVVVTGSDAEVIFNDNSVKNRKAMLIRMWANATGQMVSFCKDGVFRLVNPNEEAGVFQTEDNKEGIDFNKVQADLDNMFGKSVTMSLITTAKELAAFKNANKLAIDKAIKAQKDAKVIADLKAVFTNVSEESLDNGLVRIEFTAQAIEAPLVFAVELSSVAENFSPNRKVAPIQSAFLATFDATRSTATKTIKKHAKKVSRTIELSASAKVDADFDLRFGKAPVPAGTRDAMSFILTNANKKQNPRDMFKAIAQKFPHGFKVSGSTAEGTRHWTISIPTHILSVQGGFDKSGWSFNETVTDTYALLCLLADKASCPQLIADYAMGLRGALNGWRKDVVTSKKAFTKGSAVFDTHGMKVLSNPKAGFETHGGEEIPVIYVDESNPLVAGTAIDKNGKVAKKINDGDVVFFYRNPMIDVTPAIIRITKDQTICGKFTCAVSPAVLAWSSQTDNDGDVLWVIPAKQVGINNVDNSAEDSARAGSLMKHELVSFSLSESTMAAFGCDDLLSGIIKARDEFSVLEPTKELKGMNVIAEAEAVAKHYRIRVGQGYAAMFNAYASFIRQANNGYVFSTEELQGIKGCSFVLYEEWGLSGFSKENDDNFKAIRRVAKGKLGMVKRTAQPTNLAALMNKTNSVVTLNAKDYAAIYVAQHIVQSKLERGKSVIAGSVEAKAIKEEALSNGLFRSLTKGAFSFGSNNINPIFQQGSVDAPHSSEMDASNPFAEAMTAWKSFAANGLVIA